MHGVTMKFNILICCSCGRTGGIIPCRLWRTQLLHRKL